MVQSQLNHTPRGPSPSCKEDIDQAVTFVASVNGKWLLHSRYSDLFFISTALEIAKSIQIGDSAPVLWERWAERKWNIVSMVVSARSPLSVFQAFVCATCVWLEMQQSLALFS